MIQTDRFLPSNFSAGKSLEYVETEKARIVLLELEKDWWVVAVGVGPQTRSSQLT